MSADQDDQVTSASIARSLGVGRSTVANWRQRYADFPQPVAGGPTTPLFSWTEIQGWLDKTGKAKELAATSAVRRMRRKPRPETKRVRQHEEMMGALQAITNELVAIRTLLSASPAGAGRYGEDVHAQVDSHDVVRDGLIRDIVEACGRSDAMHQPR